MYWFKTMAVQLDDRRTLYIAWDADFARTGDTTEEAKTNLASHYLPETGYTGTWIAGGIDADDAWEVTHKDYPNVRGRGGSPADALFDFNVAIVTRWHPRRFSELVQNVINNLTDHETRTQFAVLIQDIKDGTFKYEG